MSSLLDTEVTWKAFGEKHLDRRITKALTNKLKLEHPTIVQTKGIPPALQGKDLLCRARTGSGKTICYAVPLVQRLLIDTESKGSAVPLRGLVLVPTKELLVQVHGVITSLLAFCFDVISVEVLFPGEKYLKAELPTMLITTPSSALSLHENKKVPIDALKDSLKILIVDEADLMFSFGYEEDMRKLCAMLPATLQVMLASATLSAEVKDLKGLMLHKPVVLKLEEPRTMGKLSQFYYPCEEEEKYLILYTLVKLNLLEGKTLMFVKTLDQGYKLKMFFEKFGVNSLIMNSELPFSCRQHILDAFNQNVVGLMIAAEALIVDKVNESIDSGAYPNQVSENESSDDNRDVPSQIKRKHAFGEEMPFKKPKKRKKDAQAENAVEEGGPEAEDTVEDEVSTKKWWKKNKKNDGDQWGLSGKRNKRISDDMYSLTRGVDLHAVRNVVNVDVPTSVRGYIHRVGRCARAGNSGTALTLCTPKDQECMGQIIQSQAGEGALSALKKLPMQMSDVERFQYRVTDAERGLTHKVVWKYRVREIQREALNSEKLKKYWTDHPEEKLALQKKLRDLAPAKRPSTLALLPSYLVPGSFLLANPVQQAARDEAAKQGIQGSLKQKQRRARRSPFERQRLLKHRQNSLLRSMTMEEIREHMMQKSERMMQKGARPDELPPLAETKLRKLRTGQYVKRTNMHPGVSSAGPRRRRHRKKK